VASDHYFSCYSTALDRRRHNSFSGETEELTARLDATLTRSSVDPSSSSSVVVGSSSGAAVELRLSAHASPRRTGPNRTLSDSAALLQHSAEDVRRGPDLTAGLPPIPPPRMRVERRAGKADENNSSPPRLTSNGLPPTPKVHMGACFMKVEI
jgi:hypothetical protein